MLEKKKTTFKLVLPKCTPSQHGDHKPLLVSLVHRTILHGNSIHMNIRKTAQHLRPGSASDVQSLSITTLWHPVHVRMRTENEGPNVATIYPREPH